VLVVESVASHKTVGGMSHDSEALVANMGKRRFFTKYLVGLTVAINAAGDVFHSPVYQLKPLRKIAYSLQVALAAYSNTIRWDVALNARRFSRALLRLVQRGKSLGRLRNSGA
jgi:hypothetical protein